MVRKLTRLGVSDMEFDDIAYALPDYESGFWMYCVDEDKEKAYAKIQEKLGNKVSFYYIFKKDVLFSYVYLFYYIGDMIFKEGLPFEFTEEEADYLDEYSGLFSPDESVPRQANEKLYNQLVNKLSSSYDKLMKETIENYPCLRLKDGSIIAAAEIGHL